MMHSLSLTLLLCLSLSCISPGNAQSPTCDICGIPGVTFENLDVTVDIEALGFSAGREATCRQIVESSENGLIKPEVCDLIKENKDIQDACACASSGCSLCAEAGSIFANTEAIINLDFLDLLDGATISCGQFLSTAISGGINESDCDIIQNNLDVIDDVCGCVPPDAVTPVASPVTVPVTAPVTVPVAVPTVAAPVAAAPVTLEPDVCYLCGTANATITNPDVMVNVEFLNVVQEVTCKELFDGGIQKLLTTEECSLVAERSELQTKCGCTTPSEVETSPPTNETIFVTDVIIGESDLITLQAALQSASLVEVLETEGPFTIFAPVDAAFQALDQTYLQLLGTPEYIIHLQNLLLFHVVNGKLTKDSLPAGETVSLDALNKEEVTFNVSEDASSVVASYNVANSTSNIIEFDLTASNGVVHKVDSVFIPRFLYTPLLSFLNSSEAADFSILNELVSLAFTEGLPPDAAYTIFAPTNEAFEALGEETLTSLKNPENLGTLIGILTNHVLAQVAPSVIIQTLNTSTAVGGLNLTFSTSENGTTVNEANIVTADILASDGIIHAIDSVLLEVDTVPPPVATPVDAPAVAPVTAPSSRTPCFLCGTAEASITNPELSIDVSFLGFAGTTAATCQQIVDAGVRLLLSTDQCDDLQGRTDIQEDCGCTTAPIAPVPVPAVAPVSVPVAAPVAAPTASDSICFLCGTEEASIANPDLSIDIAFLEVTGASSATCQQIVDAGLDLLLSKDKCDALQSRTDIQEDCGCSTDPIAPTPVNPPVDAPPASEPTRRPRADPVGEPTRRPRADPAGEPTRRPRAEAQPTRRPRASPVRKPVTLSTKAPSPRSARAPNAPNGRTTDF